MKKKSGAEAQRQRMREREKSPPSKVNITISERIHCERMVAKARKLDEKKAMLLLGRLLWNEAKKTFSK